MSARTDNDLPGVGGTAQDGGVSTAATVADGGPDNKKTDPSFNGDDGDKKASGGKSKDAVDAVDDIPEERSEK